MHASRTMNRFDRRQIQGVKSPSWSNSLHTWRLNCPYCLWFLLGVVLLVSAPGLAKTETPVGSLWLWLAILPMGSALLRRLLLR